MAQRYAKVVGSEMYRDGVLREAKFVRSDGEFETLWLQAASGSPRDHKLFHSRLQVFPDLDRKSPPQNVLVESELERAILEGLQTFLQHPVIDVPFADKTPDDIFLERIRDLLHFIPRRTEDASP